MAASVWKGPLISIPIRLFRAARSERVPLRELYRAESSAFAHTEESDMPASEPMRNLVSACSASSFRGLPCRTLH
jgi:hypothetical protein